MAERVTAAEPAVEVGEELAARRAQLRGRLGMNVPRDWWPTIPMLKSFEAAGFAWIQVHAPPAAILRDDVRAVAHAHALRELLDATDLRLVLHGPDELRAGNPGHDRALEGLLAYAKIARAEHVVYHAANVPVVGGHQALNGGGPLEAEERSLRRLVPLAETLGITLALENLAPVHPGPARESHTPSIVADLVRRLDSPAVRMCLDVGHAHIVSGLRGVDISRLLSPVLDTVGLFHLHDNLGARSRGERAPGRRPAAPGPAPRARRGHAALEPRRRAHARAHVLAAPARDPPAAPARRPQRRRGDRRGAAAPLDRGRAAPVARSALDLHARVTQRSPRG